MCGSMVDIQSPTTEIRRGKKEETTGWKYIWPALLHRVAIKSWSLWNSAWKSTPEVRCHVPNFASISGWVFFSSKYSKFGQTYGLQPNMDNMTQRLRWNLIDRDEHTTGSLTCQISPDLWCVATLPVLQLLINDLQFPYFSTTADLLCL